VTSGRVKFDGESYITGRSIVLEYMSTSCGVLVLNPIAGKTISKPVGVGAIDGPEKPSQSSRPDDQDVRPPSSW
jgi:hypothetical protein